MGYIEMTIEDAMKLCGKHAKVLVAVQNMEEENQDIVFVQKRSDECEKIFEDVKTVASICDDFVKQLRCFTEKQDIKSDLRNIRPVGIQKYILLQNPRE